jgi:hypothetical protein
MVSLGQDLDPRQYIEYTNQIQPGENKELTKEYTLIQTLDRSEDAVRAILEAIQTGGSRNFILSFGKFRFTVTAYNISKIQKE